MVDVRTTWQSMSLGAAGGVNRRQLEIEMNSTLGDLPELSTISTSVKDDATEFRTRHPYILALVLILVGLAVSSFIHGISLISSTTATAPRTATTAAPTSTSFEGPRATDRLSQVRAYQTRSEVPDGEGGFIVSVHVTHHAGTSLWYHARAINMTYCTPASPPYSMVPCRSALCWTPSHFLDPDCSKYHFVNLEYSIRDTSLTVGNRLASFNWESERVVSVLIVRHPMDRVLSDGRFGSENLTEWWTYARSVDADNFALRVLSGVKRPTLTLDDVTRAQTLIGRMTFVLDQACMDDNFDALGAVLQ